MFVYVAYQNSLARSQSQTLSGGHAPAATIQPANTRPPIDLSRLSTPTAGLTAPAAATTPTLSLGTLAAFSWQIGAPPPAPETLSIASSVNSVAFSATATGGFVTVKPASGQTPASVQVSLLPNISAFGAGTYTGTISVSSSAASNSPQTVPVQLVVTAVNPMLVATPYTVSFNYQQGSAAPPTQSVTVSSTTGTPLPFSVTTSGGTWLIAGASGGTSPEPLNIIVSPIGLAPGQYSGTLTLSSPSVPSLTVNVALTVTAPVVPELNVNAPTLTLSALKGGRPSTAQVQVSNAGGGVLSFTATPSGGNWLSVLPISGSIDNTVSPASGSSVSLTITADPTSLNPGTYQGSVAVTGAGSTFTIPVTFTVAAQAPVILLSQSGLTFTAAAQAGAPLAQQLGILNTGNGALNWSASASTLSGGNWLLISPPSGAVQQPYLDVNLLSASIDPGVLGGLSPGDYYGQIQIADPTGLAVNSPQVVTVILTVLPVGADPGPEIQPSGLIFTGPAGSSQSPQNVMIGIRKAVPDEFISGTVGSGFSYTPTSTTLQPNQPATMQVTPSFKGANPGDINRGTITLQFSDGTARNVSLLTVVAPQPAGSDRFAPRASNNCATLELQWRTPATSTFSVVQGQGQTLQLQVVDECGNLVGPSNPQAASVNVSFSDHDPDLRLVHIGNGIWSGTWKPGVNLPSGPVTVVATAFNSTGQTLQSGSSSPLAGSVVLGNTPLVTAAGVQQGASYAKGAPIAPGTLITLQGLNLADAGSQTSGLPLPTTWNGAQVFMGTEALPLLYTASGQVNVQVPYDVPVDTQFQLTVQRDNLQSLPEQLVIAVAQPGIFTANASGSGQGDIFLSDGVTLAQPGTPASAGQTITILCTGLGTVTPAVQAGTPPPASPASTTNNPVSVTIGGLDAQASFGTLVPGQPGVYQVSAVVPAGVSGPAVPVVVTVAGQSSPAGVTMAVQ
jgi:uncharacterized protein (TIGR03437 family)